MINTDIIKYDHGARRYRPALLGFSQPDALAESYPWLNPYLYCAANPVNLYDPSGLFSIKISIGFNMNFGFIQFHYGFIGANIAPLGGAKAGYEVGFTYDSDTNDFSFNIKHYSSSLGACGELEINNGGVEFKTIVDA